MNCSEIVRKGKNRLKKMLFSPVEGFVFHAVSDSFDETMNEYEDWNQTDDFKRNIKMLMDEYQFISLEEAHRILVKRSFRRKKYATLTSDDGYRSVLSILPFLEQHQIPITLFVNPKYLDGISRREGYATNPQYITKDDLWALNSPIISIGMHGYEHNDVTKLSKKSFLLSVDQCIEAIGSHPRFIPYYAYTWGIYSELTQKVLKEKGIIPVLTSGETNYWFHNGIDRKPIDSYYLKHNRKRRETVISI